MTKTAKQILTSLDKGEYIGKGGVDQALKELEAIIQQEVAKARLNEVQNSYEQWINGRKFIPSYFRDRIAELLKVEELEAEL